MLCFADLEQCTLSVPSDLVFFFWGGGGGVKNFRKDFAGGGVRSFYFGVGGLILLGGHIILKLKLHNTSINSIFGITNLIYFRDIWKLHLLSSDKISFSMAIRCKCLEHSAVFPVNLF